MFLDLLTTHGNGVKPKSLSKCAWTINRESSKRSCKVFRATLKLASVSGTDRTIEFSVPDTDDTK